MIEVEVKVRVGDTDEMERRILYEGASYMKAVMQHDVYFDFPDKRLLRDGCALRIREEDGRCMMTFKGIRRNSETGSREEIETSVESREEICRILERVGLMRICEVKKKRKIYYYEGWKLSLDNVEGMGIFLEIEGKANSEAEYMEKRKRIFELLGHLGLSDKDVERRSYLELSLGGRKK